MKAMAWSNRHDIFFVILGLFQMISLSYLLHCTIYFASKEITLFNEIQEHIEYQRQGASYLNKFGILKHKRYDLSFQTQLKIKDFRIILVQALMVIPVLPALIALFYISMNHFANYANRKNLCLLLIGLLYGLGFLLVIQNQINDSTLKNIKIFVWLTEILITYILLYFMALQSKQTPIS
jgi:hypothetical protein